MPFFGKIYGGQDRGHRKRRVETNYQLPTTNYQLPITNDSSPDSSGDIRIISLFFTDRCVRAVARENPGLIWQRINLAADRVLQHGKIAARQIAPSHAARKKRIAHKRDAGRILLR